MAAIYCRAPSNPLLLGRPRFDFPGRCQSMWPPLCYFYTQLHPASYSTSQMSKFGTLSHYDGILMMVQRKGNQRRIVSLSQFWKIYWYHYFDLNPPPIDTIFLKNEKKELGFYTIHVLEL